MAPSLQLLTVPGFTGSGPDHWQSLWEASEPSIGRIEQADWDCPDAKAWSAMIEARVSGCSAPVVLVAHSCGVTAVAHWAARYDTPVAGAFLVAPPDHDRSDLDEPVRRFGPLPLDPLPFPSIVIASEDDPYCDLERAAFFAAAWRSRFVNVGRAGHLNTASGHGEWSEGRRLLDFFCEEL